MNIKNDCTLVIGNPSTISKGGKEHAAKPISETQQKINELMGISEDIFQRYSNKQTDQRAQPQNDIQKMVNRLLGISEEIFLQYSADENLQGKELAQHNLSQREINEMMGISEEMFCKYRK